jgi:hypothetical protein
MTYTDSGYQAIRLRGLAALLRAVSPERLQELTNLDEVTVFLADTLDEMAEALEPAWGSAPPTRCGSAPTARTRRRRPPFRGPRSVTPPDLPARPDEGPA